MDPFRLRTIVPLGLMGLSLALSPAAAADDKKPAPSQAKPAKPAKSGAPAPAGMIAVKDADTGQFRAPTAEEAAALTGGSRTSQQNAVAPAPRTFAGPGGSTGVILDDSTTVFAVATKKPDGTVALGEVTGATNAKAAVTSPKSNPKPVKQTAKEVPNDR